MKRSLTKHPASPSAAVASIEVAVARPRPGALVLNYALTGDMADVWLPPPGAPRRADALWRRTCFEAFVRAAGGEAYVEINVSPAREWAAYGFTGYRSGMRLASEIARPDITARATDDRFELEVILDLGQSLVLAGAAPWRLGLAAVIEEVGGRGSYWALAHPPGEPDFHHAAGFAYDLRVAAEDS